MRVPAGIETCPFCIMLASRGFVYHSEGSAGSNGHYHANCDCRIVPGFDGMEVQGYDPKTLHDRYMDCYNTVADEYGHADTKAILEEMRTRDPLWLNRGTVGKVTKEQGAKPLPKEKDLATSLIAHGFNVEFIKEINTYKIKTPDAFLNGIKYEFKIPEKFNEKTVKNQFKRALGKGTGNLVISCKMNKADLLEVAADVKALFRTDEYPEITHVLIVGSDGSLKRIRRQ